MGPGIQRREYRRRRHLCPGSLSHHIVESRAFGGQLVQSWGGITGIAVSAEMVGPDRVGHDEDDSWSSRLVATDDWRSPESDCAGTLGVERQRQQYVLSR